MNYDDHIPGARGPDQSELSTLVEILLREADIPEHLIAFCLRAVAEGEAAKRDLEDARIIDALTTEFNHKLQDAARAHEGEVWSTANEQWELGLEAYDRWIRSTK